MTRRSVLLALLLAPFAWLFRLFGRKPALDPAAKNGDYFRLNHPVIFERGVPIGFVEGPTFYDSIDQCGLADGDEELCFNGVSQRELLSNDTCIIYARPVCFHILEPENKAPFSRLVGAEIPNWRFSDGDISWRLVPRRRA